jgi:hypothetical protein
LSPLDFDHMDVDTPLLNALLERWRVRYGTKRPQWSDRALFRSLNMAAAASKMPAGVDLTTFSIGRNIGLWVSAFEILTHIRFVEAAVVAPLIGFVHSEMPVASRAGKTTDVVDGGFVAAAALRIMIVLDDQAPGLVAECALEILGPGKLDDELPHSEVEAHPTSGGFLQ